MECLLKEGVRDLFGYPGGAVLALYDAFQEYPGLRHILVRHEQGAGFAAQGFARATGRVGVCVVTSGPGATNLVTAIADAYMDSIPIVCITGQVARAVIGTDAFQETDILGISMPITKHSYLVNSAGDLPRIFKEAFFIAASGRPGPVLIDIPKDVFLEEAEFSYPMEVNLPGYCDEVLIVQSQIEAAAKLINDSKRPVIIGGHGVQACSACGDLLSLAEKGSIPCAFTVHGLGTIPENHPLNLKMAGMHGHAETNFAVDGADLILGVGIRFDDRITGNIRNFAKNARVIHIDIDKAEVGKNVRTDVGIVGSCKEILPQMTGLVEGRDRLEWLNEIDRRKREVSKSLSLLDNLKRGGNEKPITYDVIRAIDKFSGHDTIIVTDVGQHQMFTCQSYGFSAPNTNLTSGGLGTMGFSLPVAMGAKVGKPQVEVWSISGDGGFQMNIQELMTIVQENIPLKIIIIQNYYLGMVRQWQEIFYKKNYAASVMSSPIYKYIAKAYGLPYFYAKRLDEVEPAVRKMHGQAGPCLGEFFVKADENVLPMVPAGANLSETITSLE